jgi:hypothetical protein
MIKAQNPDIIDDQIAFSIGALKKHGVIDSGDTLAFGIGAMTGGAVARFLRQNGCKWNGRQAHRLQERVHPTVRK